MNRADSNEGFLWRSHRILLWTGAAYVAFIGLLLIPFFQRHFAYQHTISLPLRARFDLPHQYGLAPFKTLNFKINTTDNVAIGAWYIMSDSTYRASGACKRTSPPTDADISQSLKTRPTVLFFHGSLGSRAMNYRVQSYSQISTRLDANILAIDYRGFGDSEGIPYESGLYSDARASWDWLVKNGAKPQDIVVMGHSLGTGVAAKLVSQLEGAGTKSKALVLLAPYLSVPKLLSTFGLFGIPFLWPVQQFPIVLRWLTSAVSTKFSTVDLLAGIHTRILMIHAKDDGDVPFSHAEGLFDAVMEPVQPEKRAALISTRQIAGSDGRDLVGSVQQFSDRTSGRQATFFQLEHGGHVEIIRWEGVIDLIGEVALA